MRIETSNPILNTMLFKQNRKLTSDTVLLTKVQILFKFTKLYATAHYLFSYLIQGSTLYLTALSSFSYMQQILVKSVFIFIPLQIFPNFPCYGLFGYTHHLKVDI